MPFNVLSLWAGGLRRNGQWLALVGLEALAHGRISEVVAPDETPGQAREGAQTSRSSVSKVMSLPAAGRAAVEGAIVEGVEGDAVVLTFTAPTFVHSRMG